MYRIKEDESSSRRVVKIELEKLKVGPVLVHCLQCAPTFFASRKHDRNLATWSPFDSFHSLIQNIPLELFLLQLCVPELLSSVTSHLCFILLFCRWLCLWPSVTRPKALFFYEQCFVFFEAFVNIDWDDGSF